MEKKTKCILVGLIVIMLLIGFLFFKYYFVKDVKEMLPISNEEVLSTNIVKEEDKLVSTITTGNTFWNNSLESFCSI